jgi:hypothetical protein
MSSLHEPQKPAMPSPSSFNAPTRDDTNVPWPRVSNGSVVWPVKYQLVTTFPARSGTWPHPVSITPTTIEGLPRTTLSALSRPTCANCHSKGRWVVGSTVVVSGSFRL